MLFVVWLLVFVLAYFFARQRLLKSLPRMKWLLLAVFIIYSWTTPGLYLLPYWFSPTENGVELGLAQVLRLSIVAASLQIMLTFLDKQAIVSALYYMLQPFRLLGLNPERAAMRLSLTMDDAESLLEQKHSFSQLLQALMSPLVASSVPLGVELVRLRVVQLIVLLLQVVLILLTAWFGKELFWN